VYSPLFSISNRYFKDFFSFSLLKKLWKTPMEGPDGKPNNFDYWKKGKNVDKPCLMLEYLV
jgi:hypothetical protein